MIGDVYLAMDIILGQTVVVKLEPLETSQHMLAHEFSVYEKLGGGVGIPHVRWFGTEAGFNAMAIDCLGPSLENLFTRHRYQFTRITVLTIASQLVSNSTLKHDLWINRCGHVQLHRLRFIHSRNLIHCDLKPSNITIGVGNQADVVYLIDFGLSKEFRDAKTHRHISMIPHTKPYTLLGSAVFASINSHIGLELGRKDDLESLAYVLIYFLRGALPWQGLSSSDILEMKKRTSASDLCHGLPVELRTFLEYCHSLPFDHKPNYEYFVNLFDGLLHHGGPSNGPIFDLEAEGKVMEALIQSDSTHSRDPDMVKSIKRKLPKAPRFHTR
jgi:serine/threonine protein kinase